MPQEPAANHAEFLLLAIERNAKHGQQLTGKEKENLACRLYGKVPQADVCRSLSISEDTWRRYTATRAKQLEEETNRRVLDLHLSCHTQNQIAETVGIPQQTVADKIAEFTENPQMQDSGIFRNYDQDEMEKSARRIYTVWNFPKRLTRRSTLGISRRRLWTTYSAIVSVAWSMRTRLTRPQQATPTLPVRARSLPRACRSSPPTTDSRARRPSRRRCSRRR